MLRRRDDKNGGAALTCGRKSLELSQHGRRMRAVLAAISAVEVHAKQREQHTTPTIAVLKDCCSSRAECRHKPWSRTHNPWRGSELGLLASEYAHACIHWARWQGQQGQQGQKGHRASVPAVCRRAARAWTWSVTSWQ